MYIKHGSAGKMEIVVFSRSMKRTDFATDLLVDSKSFIVEHISFAETGWYKAPKT